MIEELDLVALRADRPSIGLGRGDVGTVVHIYGTNDLYEVEFINAKGDTVAVETLNAEEVRPVDLGRVILHYTNEEHVGKEHPPMSSYLSKTGEVFARDTHESNAGQIDPDDRTTERPRLGHYRGDVQPDRSTI